MSEALIYVQLFSCDGTVDFPNRCGNRDVAQIPMKVAGVNGRTSRGSAKVRWGLNVNGSRWEYVSVNALAGSGAHICDTAVIERA